MGSIRKLKKDIDKEIFDLISDCLTYSEVHAEEHGNEITEIISDAVNFRNDLIMRVNSPKQTEDPKGVRAHYQLISKELNTGVDKFFERLSSLSKKKKK